MKHVSQDQTQKNRKAEDSALQNRCRRFQITADGKCIAEIGTYDPNTDPSTFHINEEEAKKWLSNGAQPTAVVGKLFKIAGIVK